MILAEPREMTLVEKTIQRAIAAQIIANVRRKNENEEYVAKRLAAINGGDWWTIKERWYKEERAAFCKRHPEYPE